MSLVEKQGEKMRTITEIIVLPPMPLYPLALDTSHMAGGSNG